MSGLSGNFEARVLIDCTEGKRWRVRRGPNSHVLVKLIRTVWEMNSI